MPNHDLITLYKDHDRGTAGLGKNINNGTIANGGGFTLEAAFRPAALGIFQAILSKEGQPAEKDANANTPLETLELKIRGDNNKLQIEQFDGAKNVVSVSSLASMNSNQWYYAAAVNDGSNLAYTSTVMTAAGTSCKVPCRLLTALYQGQNGYGPSAALTGQTLGPSVAGNYIRSIVRPTCFNGTIDEVRLSNSALAPSDFLFAAGSFPGDYNGDKIVDAGDYDVWRKTNVLGADGYTAWRNNFGKNYNSVGIGKRWQHWFQNRPVW